MNWMKSRFLRTILALFLVCITFIFSIAEITLPAIFCDHMVLQQQSDASIWGMASSGKTVKVSTSWDQQSYTAKAGNDGHWKLKVKTPVAGGPYDITISDGKPFVLRDVLIGEVWVCSGQSNMEMPMKGYFNQPILGANEAIATSRNNQIRLFTVSRVKSLTEAADFKGKWLECNSENVVDFSAAAYFFGRMIQDAIDVPVGLICSSWGGTRIEPWMSESGFKEFDWVELPNKTMTDEFSPQTPTVLYNAMIAPMVGYGIKGALWYQGESNRSEPDRYEKLMPGLIKNWREEWGIGDFSFYYAQIAPYDYGTSGLNSAYLREAQFKASHALPGVGMASLMDVGEKDNIHPADKNSVGKRLAYLALAQTYGLKGIAFSGPVFKAMTTEGSLVKLTFDHASNGLTTFGKELTGFKVAGEDKRFYEAKGYLTREGITLICDRVSSPVAVRYAFEDFTIGELFNTEGLPASSFRTDDWE
jgi:sialate O-acetylesterase